MRVREHPVLPLTNVRRRRNMRPAWRHCPAVAITALLLLPAQISAEAAPSPGCQQVFRAGATLTLSGKTIQGTKNAFSVAIALELTAGPATTTGVPILAGTVRSERLKDGAVFWQSRDGSRWGNRCIDAVAPDGRRWSFLALNWENDNTHPNPHAVIDWSAESPAVVGFIDTKDGAYHEAQVVLERKTGELGDKPVPPPAGEPEAGHGSLCTALFRKSHGHFFVGTGYATEPGASPGHLAMRLDPAPGLRISIPLHGRLIATEGPKRLEPHAIRAGKSACIDLPDRRYAMLQLILADDVEAILWLWGEDNVPQKDDRLMGYLTIPGSKVVRSKIALWRL